MYSLVLRVLVDMPKFSSCLFCYEILFHWIPHLDPPSIKIGTFKWINKECWEVKIPPKTVFLHLPLSWQCLWYPGYGIYMKKKNLVYSTFRHKLLLFYYSNKSKGLLILCLPASPGTTFCHGCICCVCRILCITQNFLDSYKIEVLWL